MDHIAELSFVRVIILILSMLAIVSLLFRSWLYIHWQNHKNSVEFQNMLIKMNENFKTKETETAHGENNSHRLNTEENINLKKEVEQNTLKNKGAEQFKKWIRNMCQCSFIFEFMILLIHPIPYYD